jgi:hypothetical protein
MKLRRWFVVFVFATSCAREGHVLEREAAHPPSPSAGDVEQMCSEAFLQVPGLQPAMGRAQVEAVLTAKFGATNSTTLANAIQDRKVRVQRDALFMYTEALCKSTGLPGRCVEACREAREIGKAK